MRWIWNLQYKYKKFFCIDLKKIISGNIGSDEDRSIRRLYVGNVPQTVSDGELMEFMNAAMLSANANHIPRTKPCINCMVWFLIKI